MEREFTRRLFWVPIILTMADLGSLGESVRQLYVRTVGSRGASSWDEHQQKIEVSWAAIRATVLALPLQFPHVRLVQDGLVRFRATERRRVDHSVDRIVRVSSSTALFGCGSSTVLNCR